MCTILLDWVRRNIQKCRYGSALEKRLGHSRLLGLDGVERMSASYPKNNYIGIDKKPLIRCSGKIIYITIL